jgi:carbon-monoxide dehydrogenase medium subunit
MYRFYLSPTTLDEALALKAKHGPHARLVAGGTDLLIELARGQRLAPDGGELGLIDLTRIRGLADIHAADGQLHLGPLVTHNQCVADARIVQQAFPLARACWEVGAPQIRNRATVAGNLITASPANDTIVPLLALDATVTLHSAARGPRTLTLAAFQQGFRRVDLADDEILTRISFAPLGPEQHGGFIKLGLRRAQAISVNAVAIVLTWDATHTRIAQAVISLGAVAPTVVRAHNAEAYLVGKPLDDATLMEAARLACAGAAPIDDIRSSAAYRLAMVEHLTLRLLTQLRDGEARAGWPDHPVMLWNAEGGVWPVAQAAATLAQADSGPTPDHAPALVNGRAVALAGDGTLLDSLRAAGYHGVKEGCAEGECGACTVLLDGMAVMACLVPAERAAGSHVVTVEGLSDPDRLHPVQSALVQSGGVQCGFCTPGFVMSAAKLLEERPHPTRTEAQEALTGNFCRCTGYRKILDAVVAAGQSAAPSLPTEAEP